MVAENITLVILIFSLVIILSVWFLAQRRRKRGEATNLFWFGVLDIVEGNRKRAMKYLRDSALEDSENINAFILLGDLLREEGEAAKALKIHRMLTARRGIPREWELRILKSLSLDYYAIGEYNSALQLVESALKLDSENPFFLELSLELHERCGNWKEAGETLERIEKLTGKPEKTKRALFKLEEGLKLESGEDGHRARILYKEAIKIDENCFYAYVAVGDSYAKEKRWDDAIDWFRQVAKNFPEHAYLVLERLEKAFFEKGEFSKVIELYKELLESDKENPDIAFALANLYTKMGNYEEAIEVVNSVLPRERLHASLRLLYYYKQLGATEKINQLIEELYELATNRGKLFVCASCGQKSNEELWRCPQCKEWNTFKLA